MASFADTSRTRGKMYWVFVSGSTCPQECWGPLNISLNPFILFGGLVFVLDD